MKVIQKKKKRLGLLNKKKKKKNFIRGLHSRLGLLK